MVKYFSTRSVDSVQSQQSFVKGMASGVGAPGPCGWCGFSLSRRRAISASVLDVNGWRAVQHVIRRCQNKECPRVGKEVGYNFFVKKRCVNMIFEWQHSEPMEYFFISKKCGFTTAYLRQLSRRVVFQHVSFESESQVHALEALAQEQSDMVPAKAKAKILRGWLLWRLVSWLSRMESLGMWAKRVVFV